MNGLTRGAKGVSLVVLTVAFGAEKPKGKGKRTVT